MGATYPHVASAMRRAFVDFVVDLWLITQNSSRPQAAVAGALEVDPHNETNHHNLTNAKRQPMTKCTWRHRLCASTAVPSKQAGDVAMSTRSNIAVIAAVLSVLGAPAYANNGDIGLSDQGQPGTSQVEQLPGANAWARASVDIRRQSRPRNTEGSSSTVDFSLIGHN